MCLSVLNRDINTTHRGRHKHTLYACMPAHRDDTPTQTHACTIDS